ASAKSSARCRSLTCWARRCVFSRSVRKSDRSWPISVVVSTRASMSLLTGATPGQVVADTVVRHFHVEHLPQHLLDGCPVGFVALVLLFAESVHQLLGVAFESGRPTAGRLLSGHNRGYGVVELGHSISFPVSENRNYPL